LASTWSKRWACLILEAAAVPLAMLAHNWLLSLFSDDPEQVGVEPIGPPVTFLDFYPAVAFKFQDGYVPCRCGGPTDRISLAYLKKYRRRLRRRWPLAEQ